MLAVLEPILTFFMIFFSSDLSHDNATKGFILMFIFLSIYYISSQVYANFSLCLSFVITSYRPMSEVMTALILQLVGAMMGGGLIYLMGFKRSVYINDFDIWQIIGIELFTGFFISLIYYCLMVDIRNVNQNGKAFAVGAVYGGLALSLPNVSAGNFLKILSGFSYSIPLIFGSIIGQIAGSILGGMTYKYLICENHSIKLKEIEITNDELNINF